MLRPKTDDSTARDFLRCWFTYSGSLRVKKDNLFSNEVSEDQLGSIAEDVVDNKPCQVNAGFMGNGLLD